MLINEINGFCVAADEFAELELDRVVGVHLAGGELVDGIMWDAHSSPVPTSMGVARAGSCRTCRNCTSVIIERDERLQDGAELLEDLAAVRAVVDQVVLAQTNA